MYGNYLWTPVNNPYIPWNVDFIFKSIENLKANFGTAINVGMWIFFGITAVFLVVRVIDWLTGH